MSKLLLNSINHASLLKPVLKSDIQTLTQRLSVCQLKSSFHSSSSISKDNELSLSTLNEQRRNALNVERKLGIRSRCVWTKEEDDLLIKKYNELGPKWTLMSKSFVKRPPAHCMNRINLLLNEFERGPWSKEEVDQLKKACQNLPFDSPSINWIQVQASLPTKRPLSMIKQKYKGACDPTLKLGRWTEEESQKLRSLVAKYGEDNMEMISQFMGNRTRRQCNERWVWQMAVTKKGRYTDEENEAIKKAVEIYGENFGVIAKVINSERTPRHISQHYRNIIAADVDRSRWTKEEEQLTYQTFLKSNNDMVKTKKELNSRRSVRDMWNHVLKMEKLTGKSRYMKKDMGSNNDGTNKIVKEEVENKA